MNSELTLTTPSLPVSYFLSSTDLTDVVIYAEPAMPLYRVTSDERLMKVYDSAKPNHLIAVFHHRSILSDTISFPSRHSFGKSTDSTETGTGKPMNIRQWLKESKRPGKVTAFTIDTEHGPCIWKRTSRHCYNVFPSYDPEKPIASCYIYHSFSSGQPAFVLQSAAEPLRDDIVVAYLVQRYRMMLEGKCSAPSPSSTPAQSVNCADRMFPAYNPTLGALLVPGAFLSSV